MIIKSRLFTIDVLLDAPTLSVAVLLVMHFPFFGYSLAVRVLVFVFSSIRRAWVAGGNRPWRTVVFAGSLPLTVGSTSTSTGSNTSCGTHRRCRRTCFTRYTPNQILVLMYRAVFALWLVLNGLGFAGRASVASTGGVTIISGVAWSTTGTTSTTRGGGGGSTTSTTLVHGCVTKETACIVARGRATNTPRAVCSGTVGGRALTSTTSSNSTIFLSLYYCCCNS
jgi:hypothetical protein